MTQILTVRPITTRLDPSIFVSDLSAE